MIAQRSIAVLPFVNMSSSKENEYFSDGITEEIINALTRVGGLSVTARTSSFAFKNKNIDVRSIADQLNVDVVLEGSIRREKDNVRITAQLIRSEDGVHIFSENFDRKLEDIFALQDEVSMLIADQVRENFGHVDIPDVLETNLTKSVSAYDTYLKGRHYQLEGGKEDLLKATDYFEKSINTDSTFSTPYLRASQAYAAMGAQNFIPIREGVDKADLCMLEGEGHDKNLSYKCYILSSQVLWAMWDFKKAYYHANSVIKINPSFASAHKTFAEMYTAMGDFDKAMHHAERAISIDPISPGNLYSKGSIYYLKREYTKAIEYMDKILRLDANWALAIELKAACLILMSDVDQIEAFLKMEPKVVDTSKVRSLYKVLHFDIAVDAPREESNIGVIPWHLYLEVQQGNHERALDILQESVEHRLSQFINFQHDPFLEPLHDYPRFQQLVDSIFNEALLPIEEVIEELESKALLARNEMNEYTEVLTQIMSNEKLYLNQGLSLRSLAEQIELHPNKLSWLLNVHLGKNFNEFINTYRLEDFKSKALDPAYKHLSLLGLAFESGFQSKAVFNSFFKKTTGTSPKVWLKTAEA